jgi:membrane protein required for colicin V production
MIIGFVRGFVKEIISISTLFFAVWASSYFGANLGSYFDIWLTSTGVQIWFGRILIFIIILVLGSILGWVTTKLIRLVLLGGIDRLIGSIFGALRGVLIIGLFVIVGQYSGFDSDAWWLDSHLLPHFEELANWIKVAAPKGFELIIPDEVIEKLPNQLQMEL